MLREIFRSRRFLIGLSLFIIGISLFYLKSAQFNLSKPHVEHLSSPAERNMHTPPPVQRREYQAVSLEPSTSDYTEPEPDRRGDLERKIDRQIDRVIGLIDEILE